MHTDTCRVPDELINSKEELKVMRKGNLRVGRKERNNRIPSVGLMESQQEEYQHLKTEKQAEPQESKTEMKVVIWS